MPADVIFSGDQRGNVGFTAADPVAQKVEERWFAAKEFRKTYDADFTLWDRYYLGHHYNAPRAGWRSSPVKNFIFATIETSVPIMTDSVPQIIVIGAEPNDNDVSEVLGHIIRRIWVDQYMDQKLPEIVKTDHIYGTAYAKVWWNPNLKGGLGDVAISFVDTRHIYPSPGSTDIDDADYVCFAANMPLASVARMYPDVMDYVKSGRLQTGPWDASLTVEKPLLTENRGANYINTTVLSQGTTTTFNSIPRTGRAPMDRNHMVTLVELWDRNTDGHPQVTVVCNGVTLREPFSPFKHDMFPFIPFINYQIPGQFFGMSEIQQLYKIQDFINDRNAQLQDIIRLTANPPFIADLTSGVNTKALVNRPGALIWKHPGTEVRWGTPPPIPSALFDVQTLDKSDFDTISGVHDVTQGRRPTGVEAAAAIVELQEAAQTRIRQKVRLMEASLRRMGKQIISLVQQFYTEERAIRIVGKGMMQENPFVQVNVPVPDGIGGIKKLNDLSVGEYDLEIGVGSTMPVSKTRRFSQFLQMYRDGLVGPRAVLQNAGLSPDEVETYLAEVQQQQQMLMQAQMGQAPPGGQAGTAVAETGEIENTELPTEDELRQIEEDQGDLQLGV